LQYVLAVKPLGKTWFTEFRFGHSTLPAVRFRSVALRLVWHASENGVGDPGVVLAALVAGVIWAPISPTIDGSALVAPGAGDLLGAPVFTALAGRR
jgi:hypothetical protein